MKSTPKHPEAVADIIITACKFRESIFPIAKAVAIPIIGDRNTTVSDSSALTNIPLSARYLLLVLATE
jgi:hypothetical protein